MTKLDFKLQSCKTYLDGSKHLASLDYSNQLMYRKIMTFKFVIAKFSLNDQMAK